MRLVFDEARCSKCRLCLKACPLKPCNYAVFDCMQCEAVDAECSACEATRCELAKCVAGGASPPCVKACPEEALSVSRDILGWRIEKFGEYFVEAPAPQFSFGGERERLLEKLLREYIEIEGEAAGESESDVGASEALSEALKKLKQLLKNICKREALVIEKSVGEALAAAAAHNTAGFGVLDFLLVDDELEEVSVIGVNRPIYVFHRKKGWLRSNCVITREEFAVNAINKMARPLGRRVSYQNPRLNATLPNGARLHACIDPLTLNKVELTIRKFRERPLTIIDLINFGTLSAQAAAFLWLALYADVSLLVTGNTGSGKTSLLNALFTFIPLSDRVVVTEETPEINVAQKHCVRVVANEELAISLRDLVKDTLRMRPDRVIIGEVRSHDEVEALFDSLLAGQARGSYATFHANDSREALTRLTALGARPEDLRSIDLILVLRRITLYDAFNKKQKEVRRCIEIAELHENELVKLFEYDAERDALRASRALASSEVLRKISVNYGASPRELLKEMRAREKFLHSLFDKNLDYKQFSLAANNYLFGERK